MDHRAFKEKAVEFMMDRRWKEKTAKRKAFQQSLFDHTIVELDALLTLLPLLRATFTPPLTVQEEQVLLASVVAHDVGKERDEWQEYILDRRHFESDVNRELTEEVVPQLASLFGFSGLEEIISGVLLHMRHERTSANVMGRVLFGGHTNPRWKTLADVVDAVDNLCSAKGLFAGLECLEQRTWLAGHVRSAYHLVQFRGVSTTLLHCAAIDAFVAHGWSPLLHYSNGTIYVAASTTATSQPAVADMRLRLGAKVREAMGSDFTQQVVGNPIFNVLPKPELFDYREVRQYLEAACARVTKETFLRGNQDQRLAVARKYSQLCGEDQPTLQRLQEHRERIARAYPEMSVFAFFKKMLHEGLLGEPGSEALAAAYDREFGQGGFEAFSKSSAQLSAANQLARLIDPFWALQQQEAESDPGTGKVEYALDATRQRLLIRKLAKVADSVYATMPAEQRPQRAGSEQIADSFMSDLAHPAPQLNLEELVSQQLHAYAATKRNARRDKDAHLCPICNAMFHGGTEAKADFLANPEAHTNRAISHGGGGKIVICDACKYERFLQQLLLGSKVADVLVLFPRMNIGRDSGEVLRRKAIEIWEAVLTRMTEANPDPDRQVSLALTYNLARKLADVDIFRLSPANVVDLMTYESGRERKKQHRKELEDRLKELYDTDDLTVDVLNENWATEYDTTAEALQALVDGEVADDDARKARAAAFRLVPQLRIVCQTPHMMLVPLTNPITLGNESETNAGIRELLVTLMLGLALDCSVALVKPGEVITFEGGEGVARVPPVPALRDLIGTEWVPLEDPRRRLSARKWLDAIAAVALLSGDTAFPERSNLYAILRSMTAGHVLRRIEQQEERRKREGKGAFSPRQRMGHLELLETLTEVLR